MSTLRERLTEGCPLLVILGASAIAMSRLKAAGMPYESDLIETFTVVGMGGWAVLRLRAKRLNEEAELHASGAPRDYPIHPSRIPPDGVWVRVILLTIAITAMLLWKVYVGSNAAVP